MRYFLLLLTFVIPGLAFAQDVVTDEPVPTLISEKVCQAGYRSGDECISLYECAQYSDGCNSCTVTEDGELGACTLRQCVWEGIPQCEQFVMPSNLSLSPALLQSLDMLWDRVVAAVAKLSSSTQQETYVMLVTKLSAKVEEMMYTQMVAQFTQEGARIFTMTMDSYRYVLYKARLMVK